MAINWYPGHMHKANKEMTKVLPQVDLVIELLDCRLPYSSQNPAIGLLGKDKPCIKILSKSDLADPELTAQWQAYFERTASVKTLLSTLDQPDKAQKLIQLCHKLTPDKPKSGSNILAMITGIPNVGKSTLINAVAGRKVAKTGNEPAITKGLQKIKLNEGIVFLDTPGILWPKIHNENSGYRLAATGAIKDTAIEVEDIALYLSGYLIQHYPQMLLDRYELDAIPATDIEFLELVVETPELAKGLEDLAARFDFEFTDEVSDGDLDDVAGGATLSKAAHVEMSSGQLTAPFIPGGAVLSAAMSGIGQLKNSLGG
jgi:ribosome biogenesis GTPase A